MQVEEIKKNLDNLFPSPKCELEYNSPYQLLIAVILSAQCTDKRVNIVTKELFKDYGTPEAMAKASQEVIEDLIHSCGFYHNKAKNIIACSKDIVEKHNGKVPEDFEGLCSLAGVGRKTANVVTAEAFGGDAIAVDTHVLRVSNRLGLVKTDDPNKCEEVLRKVFPQKYWSELHLQMVHFGRYKCKSQNPDCKDCPFTSICFSFKEKQQKKI